VFLAGRVILIGAHELAHALTMASFGRPVRRAGIKFVLVFPSVFVDTSASWLEPRRRRLEVTAAGPISDLALAGAFSLAAAALAGTPTARAVLFQLAVAAYTGALLNLNPCVTRDGYQLLVDLLREPNLRRRALERLSDRLKGRSRPATRALGVYAVATLMWSAVVAGLITVGVLRMTERLRASVPSDVVPLLWPAVVIACAASLLPLLLLIVPPLVARRRERRSRPAGLHDVA
jgi:putative peptide zinc metalloprotease protein